MAKIDEGCIEEAFKALPNLSKVQLRKYASDVLKTAREIDPARGTAAIDAAIEQVRAKNEKLLFETAKANAENILKFNNMADAITNHKADARGVLAGRSLIEWYSAKVKTDSNWRKINVPDSQAAEWETTYRNTVAILSNDEMKIFTDGSYDKEIMAVFDGKKSSDSKEVNNIVKMLKNYFPMMRARLIDSGAMTDDEFHERRYFGAVHDAEKMMNGGRSWARMQLDKRTGKFDPSASEPAWRDQMKKRLDVNETFKRTNAVDLDGKVSESKVDSILKRNWSNIITNKGDIFGKSAVVVDKDVMERRSKIFFVWKNLSSLGAHNEEYGNGSLFNMFVRDARAGSNKIGTANVWGSNAATMYNDIRHLQQKVDPKSPLWWSNTDNYFNNVMGLDKLNTAPGVSTFFQNQRTWTSMARLPTIALQSISDIAYVSSFAERFGHNYWSAWGYHLTHLFDTNFTNDVARQEAARLFATQVDHHLGHMGRWGNEMGFSSLTNKISTGYFRLIGMEAFDRGNKVGNLALMMKGFGRASDKSWDELNDAQRKMLDRFISPQEWEALRSKTQRGLFSIDNALALTNDEVLHVSTLNLSSEEYKNDLYRRVYAMFLTNTQNTVLTPTAFENAFTHFGTKPGSIPGVIFRELSQFKQYALAAADRVYMDGYRNADSVQQKLHWGLNMIIGTLPLSYASYTLNNLANGLSNADPNKMRLDQKLAYYSNLIAPSFAIGFGILDTRNQNSMSLWSLLGSPSTRLISDGISTLWSAIEAGLSGSHADEKRMKKNATATAGYFLPIGNFPGISPLVRQAMGDHAYLQPGQKPIYGR